MPKDPAPKPDEPIELLDGIIVLLETYGRRGWTKYMRDARTIWLGSAQAGARHIVGAYGGMGSLNEGIALKGRFQARDQARLDALLARLHALSRGILSPIP